ncbi:phosphodiester glycosidase family protein [Paenibacillus sp. HN-1]|uniref:phosphodiester glycosidase family protein n=1 Tax=Paenibacillus TaxID=44249 RepID=UPI001CA93903|nr:MULTISPECIES: phosphodiester glycosidase family protein [Paenibacillus]MBY9080449.1 phosphodiester glycosidase family protein [Paenibacillus sp. CGMCC 1.18879]MBY9084029.1 phosphodiester glycosidase family protein [Paenibacillus sinensis]
MTPVKRVNRFFMLATAPFLGLLLCLLLYRPSLTLDLETQKFLPDPGPLQTTDAIGRDLELAKTSASSTTHAISATAKLYRQTTSTMGTLVDQARTQAARPEQIYNRRISSRLGFPYDVIDSSRITIELYRLNPGDYTGYAMKVKLKDQSAMTMSLPLKGLGSSETTLQAVSRYGAVAGINAGGFADQDGKRYPLSTTIVDGKYLTGFEASYKDLSFVGLNQEGKLIGGKFNSRQQLDALNPRFGASFVPVLLQDGYKTAIPAKWQTAPRRAPRTAIGSYKDDQLLIIVAEGYNENGSSGATLDEIQDKLFKMGVINAYNLDGGGSTSLIFKGRVVNKPSDGVLRSVPTSFLFFK